MKKNRNISLAGTFICLLITLAGCRHEYSKLHDGVEPEQIPPLSKKIVGEIFYDASYSMFGYVKPDNSYYTKTLQLLERSFLSGWPEGKINYYKFGSRISQIQRKDALEAAKTYFYFDPSFTQKTHIENVIIKANENNLTLIVTDLFQNDADVNLLLEKLNEKFLLKNLAVGILGIKSEFDGVVCDVGLQDLNFKYSTQEKKQKYFRPFFVLMLSKHKNIEHFYEKMIVNGLESFQEKKFIIFSAHLVERLASFENSSLSEVSKMKEVTNILPPDKRNDFVKQFIVQGNPQKAYFESITEIFPLQDTINFAPKQLEFEIKAWECREQNLTPCEDAVRGFVLKNPTISNSKLKFRVEIIPANFPANGTYCFEMSIRPSFMAYSLPRWISEWDMNLNLLEKWKNDPNTFDGASTMNLKNFLNNIWQIIYQIHKPKIAKIFCYIKKD